MAGLHDPIKAALLDTLTGVVAVDERASLWGYTNGNWSCDCNRGNAFGLDLVNRDVCIGCKRFLVVRCDDRENYTLREMNPGYPEALLDEFLPEEGG